MTTISPALAFAADIASWGVLAAAILTLVRMLLGPTTADRAVALDMLGVLMAAFAALRALVTGVDAYLDVALVIALAGFLTTLAFARFIARSRAGGLENVDPDGRE